MNLVSAIKKFNIRAQRRKTQISVAYVFCESFVQLENTMKIVVQNSFREIETVVLVGTPALYKLFKKNICIKYRKVAAVKLFPEKSIASTEWQALRSVSHLIATIITVKKIYKNYFRYVNHADVYMFCRYYNLGTYVIYKKICDKNRVHFIESRDYSDEGNLEPIRLISRHFIRKLFLWIIFGSGIHYVKYQHGELATQINKNIYFKCFEYVSAENRQKWLGGDILNCVGLFFDSYKVIFYDFGDEIHKYILNVENYRATIVKIMGIIKKYYDSSEVGIKFHPTFKPSIELEPSASIIESYIPGEWVQNDGALLIGIFSTCVYNAKHGRPVSLINLFEFRNLDMKANFISATLSRDTTDQGVLMPKNLDEFESIIKSHGNNLKNYRGINSLF